MRITQGTFSYLPDLTDDEVAAQIQYAIDQGWSIAVEFTDDPHPRNFLWEMWGLPMFDITDAAAGLHEVRACRDAYPEHYIRVNAYDASLGRQTTALSFIVNRPSREPGFRLDRQEGSDRQIRYSLQAYATQRPAGERYGRNGIPGRRRSLRARRRMSAAAGPAGGGFAMPRPGPGGGEANGKAAGPGEPGESGSGEPLAPGDTVELGEEQQAQRLSRMLDEFDREFVGLAPVKARVREIAALLLIDRLRQRYGLTSSRPSLHMCFTGSPGTGKTTVAMHMGEMLRELGYLRKGQLVSVTRDDLVGQYVGHTAPKTKEVLKRAMGGVLLIDEAYYLYRPENERDYGQEAIEILLQFMEAHREDLVVILAGYADRMDVFFRSNPGMASRIAHHIDFPDFSLDELMQIAGLMLDREQYQLSGPARAALTEYVALRMTQPRFANARSIRNAIDRMRLRQARRLVAAGGTIGRDSLMEISEADVRASRVFGDTTPPRALRPQGDAAPPPRYTHATPGAPRHTGAQPPTPATTPPQSYPDHDSWLIASSWITRCASHQCHDHGERELGCAG